MGTAEEVWGQCRGGGDWRGVRCGDSGGGVGTVEEVWGQCRGGGDSVEGVGRSKRWEQWRRCEVVWSS